jgi:uncharacterized cupin superfamily protein
MPETVKPVINIADVPLRDNAHGETFEAKIGSFGRTIGSTGIGVMLHVVEPGKAAFPFHAHHQTHELFVILEGEGTYRLGEDSYPVKAGDVLAAPTGGPEAAHQIINTGAAPLKYLGISASPGTTEVVEYPDSKKFAVTSRYDWATGKGGVRYIGRQENSLDYWEGE